MTDQPQDAPACAVCSTTMTFSFSDSEAGYYLCGNCDYLTPVVHGLDARELNDSIYSEAFDHRLEEAGKLTDRKRRKYAHFLTRIAPYRQNNRILDIGCGAGRLLRVAAEHDWEAFGVDPAMQKLSVETPDHVTVIPELLNKAGFEPDFFDVVHANEVFEHIDNPVDLVEDILAVLRPGGLLVFRTPNHSSWTAKAVGQSWRHFNVRKVGHVGFFSPKSARHLLNNLGFDKVTIATHHFSLRDRWPGKTPGIGLLLRLGYRGVGQVARFLDRGERMTVYGQVGRQRADASTTRG